MDNAKALEVLRRWNLFISYSIMGHHSPFSSLVELSGASTTAIKALEKQTPRAVKYNNRHGNGADLWNKDYFNCPSCGRRLRNKKPDPFCPRCGQALNWEVSV